MITIFNRRELITTFSMARQAEIRGILRDNRIDYTLKTINRNSPSPFAAGPRARMGALGQDSDSAYEYIIYVKKKDCEQANHLISAAK